MKRKLLSVAIPLVIVATPLGVRAQWIPNGTPATTAPGNQASVVVAPSPLGAIVAWVDGWDNPAGSDIYAQHFDRFGIAQWTPGGIPICTATKTQWRVDIVGDGTGGAILAWLDWRLSPSEVYAQRIDESGNQLWGTNGRVVCAPPAFRQNLSLVSDEQGGAIIFWEDSDGILAQHVDESGALLWNANGVPICTAEFWQYAPRGTPDGAGGAVITWQDEREYPAWGIYAQRVDASGTTSWTTDGVKVSAAPGDKNVPEITSDGSEGAIIVWWGIGLFAQRIDSSGNLLWTANGVPVCTAPGGQSAQKLIPGGDGGAIMVWNDSRTGPNSYRVYAQRMDGSGAALWAENGVVVCSASNGQPLWPRMVEDGGGGAIVTWHDHRGLAGVSRVDIYAQRMDVNGTMLWTPNGVQICVARDDQSNPTIATDGADGAIIAWEDPRDRAVSAFDIYVQRVYPDGGTPTSVRAPHVSHLIVGSIHPNPSSGTAIVELELKSDAEVSIDIVDVSGRRVASTVVRTLREGTHAIELGASDVGQQRLASGVYFCRVHAAGETVARKMVIAR